MLRFVDLACGAALWGLTALVVRPGLAELLLLLGPTLAVPLGLALAAPPEPGRDKGRWRFTARLVLPAAAALCLSFALDRGAVAALLALPWLAVTGLIASLGLLRCLEDGGKLSTERAIDAGLLYLAVGGAWTLASRWGVELFGFREPIVILTGAHFHFAGFVLPILAGVAARCRPGWLARVTAAGVVGGVPLTALGITLGARGWLGAELVTAAGLAAAGCLVALLQTRVAQQLQGTLPAALLILSSGSLAVGMTLAAAYALGRWLGSPWLDIETMTRFHATANVFGFSLCGLLAWALERPPPARASWHVVIPCLGDRERREDFDAAPLAPGAVGEPPTGATRDRHELLLGHEEAGPPASDGIFACAAAAISRFAVFPSAVAATFCPQARVEAGDVLGLSYRLAPGMRLLFASRVVTLIAEREGGTERRGFTLATLVMHPFVGVESFVVEKDLASGAVRAVICSWSRPQLPIVVVLQPWVRRLQLRGARAALEELATSTAPAPHARRH